MMNLTSKTSKSLLLFKRALVLLCLVLCSLMANAGGTSWNAKYQVKVQSSSQSTGAGTVYLRAESGLTNGENDGNSLNTTLAPGGEVNQLLTTGDNTIYNVDLSTSITIGAKGTFKKTYYRTGYKYQKIHLRAVAAPGSKFVRWEEGIANDAIIREASDNISYEKDKGSDFYDYHDITYHPIFTIRTYFYATPSAQTTEGGTICATGTTSTRPADADPQWSASISQGSTLSQQADNNGMDACATIGTYYYHAKAEDGYVFVGWYDKNGVKLSETADFGYNLVATSEKSGSPTTDVLNAMFVPECPATISPENVTTTGLYTGTKRSADDGETYKDFPYRKKTPIDLTRTFDAGGNALFDKLYIFGMTTSVDGGDKINQPSNVIPCNAKTICYVYKKSTDGTYYEYETMFDAVENRFDHGASMNGKHLYFTGYCPFAYMGVNATEEGWMYFKDDKNKSERTVDIYLDNCEIMGRYKTPTGKNANYNEYTLELTADIGTIGGTEPNNSFIFGASSPFIFTSARTSSSEPYQPTIHIAGQNHLQGQLGSFVAKTVGHLQVSGRTVATIDAGIPPVYTYSAPITIKPLDLNTFTDLVMTDIWKDNTITNGYIKLDATKPTNSNAEKVVAIDLGSKNGSLTINGGQYHLRNSAADGSYACNLAIGYRRFSKLVERDVDVPIIGTITVKMLLHLYGFGGDVADCKVIINSGTFTMYKNMYMNGSTPLGSEYYKDQVNFLDLRLPAGEGNSRINGGTFNGISNVLMCSRVTTTGASPKNGYGDWLCLQDVVVTSEKTSYGSDKFNIPDPFNGYTEPQVLYDLLSTENKNNVSQGRMYGGQSANSYTKEDDQIVRLLLPGTLCDQGGCVDCEYQKETTFFQWATAIPRFQAKKTVNGQVLDANVGGSINVEENPIGEDVEYLTNQLLYMDCAGMENYSMNLAAQGATLTFDDPNLPRGQVGNENDYWILRHLNILKSVQADTWYTFTAPFDVHDISVIETSENTIKKKTRTEALELQAKDNLQLLYGWQDVLIPNEQGRASSFTLEALLGARRKKLVHYDGTNIMAANYYLYELDPDSLDANGHFSTDNTGTTLNIDWKPVKRDADKPLMYQGETYAIQFPWCPMCNDLDTRTYYDYWSNKMILFHGKGPQEVLGTNGQSSLSTAPTAGSATLAGNATLADMNAPSGAYVHQYIDIDPNDDDPRKQDWFVQPTGSYTVKPTEGYMLYTPKPGAQMPARISRSGKIEYDENVETSVGGVPTVGDRTSLMLFGAYDGFEILSLCEQLVTVYNLQGNIVFQQYMAEGEQVHIAAAEGLYVVKDEREAIKVMVE